MWNHKAKTFPNFLHSQTFPNFSKFICPSIVFKIDVLHDGMPYIVITIKTGLKTKEEITSFTYLLI